MSGPHRPPATTALPLLVTALLFGCDGGGDPPSGLDTPDMQLAERYAVTVEVLEAGAGCVIGGLTPSTGEATARVSQQGATVRWFQAGENGVGAEWRLSGHVCPGEAGDRVVRLRGGRAWLVEDGDDVCRANFSLPTRHTGSEPTINRCEDDRCVALELVPDGCGGFVADFEAKLHFFERCEQQPDCLMRLRWRATPEDGVDETDGGCVPSDVGDGGRWMEACRTR